MQNIRRYDIDWLRVIAIGLLLIYHISIAFQPWALLIGFIQSNESIPAVWTPMAMLNVWRIPLLFFVSGMGVYFAMRKRNWKELIKERSIRILLPYIFGLLVIVPLHVFIILDYYNQPLYYDVNPGHLWFLGNIFAYVLILSPLFYYLKNNQDSQLSKTLKKIFSSPIGILVMVILFLAEVALVKPNPFELYAMTWHGFFYGFLAFLFGYLCVFSGEGFWHMILKARFVFLVVGLGLYLLRVFEFNFNAPWYLLPVESLAWILSAFAFGYKYLNRPSKTLSYLSEAAYPVYIIHMFALYGASYLIFPTTLSIELQLILVILITAATCMTIYELLIKRVSFLRPLFGLRPKAKATTEKALG